MCVFKYSLVIFGKTNHRKLWVSELAIGEQNRKVNVQLSILPDGIVRWLTINYK